MLIMIMTGMIYGYSSNAFTKTGRFILRIAIALGVVAAIWMAYMKNATSKISTPAWNFRIFSVSFIAFALFLVFTVIESIFLRKNKTWKISGACISLSVYTLLLLFATLPPFLEYPYTLAAAESTVFSSSYILKLSGVIVGFVLALVASFAADRMGRRLGRKSSFVFLLIMMLIEGVNQVGKLLSAMLNLQMLTTKQVPFQLVVYIVNHDTLFTYLIIAVACAAALVMLIRSLNVHEPYSNPAQHRKIRAKWRLIRKWACTSLITAGIAVLLLTVVNSVVNAEVQMAPTEDTTIDGDNAVVTFDQVSDGHLHRYGYTTQNGIQVRFIVIKKPNSTTYGVGMDCCDICGETGYYENKAGDVVCSRCNVIMNINTIGFEGGCNPKVVEYTVDHGKIIIPIEQLTQYEKDFRGGRGTGSASAN